MKTRRVVIADNNEFYRQVLGDFYRELGWEVRLASEGIEALELVTSTVPDLLILDLIMPCLDGATLCAHIKGNELHRNIPVVILSGILADEIDNRDAIGADAWIAKMPLPELQAALRETTEILVAGKGSQPLMRGFDKMYRREVVLELLADRKLHRDILDSLSEGIAELSRDRRLLSTNRSLQELTGLPAASLLSRPMTEIFTDSRPVIEEMFAEVDRGARMACRRIGREGRALEVKLHSFPHRGAAAQAMVAAARDTEKVKLEAMLESVGYTMLVEDITDRVKAESDRLRLADRLAGSDKLASVGLLASGAAHELNNPLTAVLGQAQLLALKVPPELRGSAESIAAAARRCRAIVENLSAFARFVRPQRAAADLNDLLRDALAECRERMVACTIDLEVDLAGDLPAIQADGAQVRRAFQAIMDNAVRALGDCNSVRRLRVSTSWSADKVTVTFEDSGPGIPPAVLGRIFDPFFTTREVGDGTGLGLSVAWGVVTGHGGKIRAANRGSGGASIMLEFPRKSAQIVHGGPPAAETRAAPEPALQPRGRRVLIADEVVVVQELLVDMLEEGEHHIDTAVTGADAMSRAVSDDYDLLIVDMRLPDMTGRQIYDQLADLRPEMLRRLVFMTAGPVPAETEEFLRRTGAPCLVKPFEVARALSVVEEILRAD